MKHPVTTHHKPVYLEPGDFYIGRRPAVVQTVLGSCVAITMHSPQLRYGAICHALLPTGSGHSAGDHVDEAVVIIYKKMLALGARQDELVVKLFGGSRVLSAPADDQNGKPPIGETIILIEIQSSSLSLSPAAHTNITKCVA